MKSSCKCNSTIHTSQSSSHLFRIITDFPLIARSNDTFVKFSTIFASSAQPFVSCSGRNFSPLVVQSCCCAERSRWYPLWMTTLSSSWFVDHWAMLHNGPASFVYIYMCCCNAGLYEELWPTLETVCVPSTYWAVFHIREWWKGRRKRRHPQKHHSLKPKLKGLSLLTLRPEQNKHTPQRHWSLCWPSTGSSQRGGADQQESPQTSKFTPPKEELTANSSTSRDYCWWTTRRGWREYKYLDEERDKQNKRVVRVESRSPDKVTSM